MHISHCIPPPFFSQRKYDSAKHCCSRLHSWVHVRPKAAVFWRGYKVSRIGHFCDCISLSFSYISFFLSGYPQSVPRQRRLVTRLASESGGGAHGNPPCFPAHGRARERGRCITYQSSCRGRLTQREGENITRNDQNMQMITSSRTTLISFFPSQSLADQPDRPATATAKKKPSYRVTSRGCVQFLRKNAS